MQHTTATSRNLDTLPCLYAKNGGHHFAHPTQFAAAAKTSATVIRDSVPSRFEAPCVFIKSGDIPHSMQFAHQLPLPLSMPMAVPVPISHQVQFTPKTHFPRNMQPVQQAQIATSSKRDSETPCMYGDGCKFAKAGVCRFYHQTQSVAASASTTPDGKSGERHLVYPTQTVAPSTSVAHVKRDSDTPCMYGDGCMFAKTGVCRFSHPTRPTVSHPTQPPVSHPTQPTVSHPTQPPVSHPTQPPVSHPTQPPVYHPTQHTVSHPTQPPVYHPTQPTVSHPIHSVTASTSVAPSKLDQKICKFGSGCRFAKAGGCIYAHPPPYKTSPVERPVITDELAFLGEDFIPKWN